MKKFLSLLLALTLVLTLSACGAKNDASDTSDAPENDASETPASAETAKGDDSRTLIVYFSCTGTTKSAAERLAALTGADLYKITPEEPYTSDDLNYNDDNCRANREMNDAGARPALAGDMPDLTAYDTVLLGYPIWWGTMPRVINTLLENCDFSGKTILPFCTSGSSGIAQSAADLKEALPNSDVRGGLRMNSASDDDIAAWLAENGVNAVS